MFNSAINLLKEIESFGYEAYIVGGFVRDYILTNTTETNDIDIVTNIPFEILKIYETADISKNKNNFNVIIIEYEGYKFEVASFRGCDIYEDLKHRDFTINALAMDKDMNIICHDISNSDLDKHILRIGILGDVLFEADPLRILRGIRFAVKYNLTVEDNTWNLMKTYFNEAIVVDRHRVYDEFMKGISLNNWTSYIEYYQKFGCDFLKDYSAPNCELFGSKSRFLWCFRHCFDVNSLMNSFTLTNEDVELISYYRNFWRIVVFEEVSSYELYMFITSNKGVKYKDICLSIFEAEKIYKPDIWCKSVLNLAKNVNFITGKDVERVLGIKNSVIVGELIRKTNEILLKDFYYDDKDNVLRKVYLMLISS